jgi:hypothetical protein
VESQTSTEHLTIDAVYCEDDSFLKTGTTKESEHTRRTTSTTRNLRVPGSLKQDIVLQWANTLHIFLKGSICWDLPVSSMLKVNRRFGGPCLNHQGPKISQARNQSENRLKAEHCLSQAFTCSSETSAFMDVTSHETGLFITTAVRTSYPVYFSLHRPFKDTLNVQTTLRWTGLRYQLTVYILQHSWSLLLQNRWHGNQTLTLANYSYVINGSVPQWYSFLVTLQDITSYHAWVWLRL